MSNRVPCGSTGWRWVLSVLSLAGLLGGLALETVAAAAAGPLRVLVSNPHYFTADGREAVYLTGSHTWLNFQDGGVANSPLVFDFDAYLDLLESHHHNFIRLWLWEGTGWTWTRDDRFSVISPVPFRRSGPGEALDGKPRFDLRRFNDAYFERMRKRIVEASRRGMYVGVTLFTGLSVAQKRQGARLPSPWPSHPFNRANNINGIDGDPNGDGDGYEVHELRIPAVTAIQDAYVRRVIDTLNDLDNVIYEICNEAHGSSTAWQYRLIGLIRDYERTKPKQHPIWMSFQVDGIDPGDNPTLFASAAEAVSPGVEHGVAYESDPPITSGRKVVILDTDHLHAPNRRRADWVWRSFTRGHNVILIDDPFLNVVSPKSMNGVGETRRAMGQTRLFAERMDLAAMAPTDDSSACSTGYCLRAVGDEYLVYQPASAGTVVRLDLAAGQYACEWNDPVTGEVRKAETRSISKPGVSDFTPPVHGPIVLYLKKSDQVPKSPQRTSR